MADHAYIAQLRAVIADFQNKLELATQSPLSQSDLPAMLLMVMSSTTGASTYYTINKLATVSADGVAADFLNASILVRDLIALLAKLNDEYNFGFRHSIFSALSTSLLQRTIDAIETFDYPRIEPQPDGTRIVTDFISDGAVASDDLNVG